MESQTEKTFFILIVRVSAAFIKIQKDRRFFCALIILQNFDNAFLFGHEQAVASVTRMSDHNGSLKIKILKSTLDADCQWRISHGLICCGNGSGRSCPGPHQYIQ